MKYQIVKATGSWLDKSKVVSGSRCKLVTETVPSEGLFEGKTIKNNVSKIRFEGEQGESKNVNVNTPSINALIEAYGEDSKDWVGKILTAQTEKMVVAGKRVIAIYLIPEGFELKEDFNGYIVISRIGDKSVDKTEKASDYPAEEVNVDDIPF